MHSLPAPFLRSHSSLSSFSPCLRAPVGKVLLCCPAAATCCACCRVLAPNSAVSSLPQPTYFNQRGIQQQMPVCDLNSCARCSCSSPRMEEPGLRKSSRSDVCDSCMQRMCYAENHHHLRGQEFGFKMCNNFSAF